MAKLNERGFWTDLARKILKIIFKNASAPKTNNQHVVPHEDGWAIRGEGNERYTSIHRTQKAAIRRAKQIARNYGSDVIIHRSDGTIRDRQSY